ncbi:MAG: CV_2116 domain-containing protein [Candidatus Scalindua sp.]
MTTKYKDYDLDTSTSKSAGSDDWMTSVHVNKLSSDGYKTKGFYCKELFETKEEADDHSVNLGKQIVDGTHPDLKINF